MLGTVLGAEDAKSKHSSLSPEHTAQPGESVRGEMRFWIVQSQGPRPSWGLVMLTEALQKNEFLRMDQDRGK